jgi:FKBP-type peptidyl-prolyl cis-trans isomerase FklB
MKKLMTLSALLVLLSVAGTARAADPKPAAKPAAAPTAAPAKPAAEPAKPAGPPSAGSSWSLNDKAGYIIGFNLGKNLRTQEIPVTSDQLIKGLHDGLGNIAAQLSDEEIQQAMGAFQEQVAARQQEKLKVQGEKNKKEGEAFLAGNKAKAGVKTTASGLQYEVIKEGTGPTAKATDKVTVNYKGTLIDGKVFDSSYDRGQPVTFGVNQVIPGWVEALQLMKAGSKYHLVIPSSLAYGEAGAGADIGPGSVLQFDVEVMKIEPGDKPEAPPAAEPKMDSKPPGK